MPDKLIMGVISGWAEKFGFTLSDDCEQRISDALSRPLVPDLSYLVDHANCISLYVPTYEQTNVRRTIVVKCDMLDPALTARIQTYKES